MKKRRGMRSRGTSLFYCALDRGAYASSAWSKLHSLCYLSRQEGSLINKCRVDLYEVSSCNLYHALGIVNSEDAAHPDDDEVRSVSSEVPDHLNSPFSKGSSAQTSGKRGRGT